MKDGFGQELYVGDKVKYVFCLNYECCVEDRIIKEINEEKHYIRCVNPKTPTSRMGNIHNLYLVFKYPLQPAQLVNAYKE